jgi:hypothetical protein
MQASSGWRCPPSLDRRRTDLDDGGRMRETYLHTPADEDGDNDVAV